MTRSFGKPNGPAFSEYLYTVAALWNSPLPRILTHVLFLLIAAGLAGGFARCAGAAAIYGVAACLAIPVIVNQSSIAYSDLSALAFAAAAFAPLLDCSRGAAEPRSWQQVLAAGILLAFAASTKPFTLAAAPGLALVVLLDPPSPIFTRWKHVALILAAPRR